MKSLNRQSVNGKQFPRLFVETTEKKCSCTFAQTLTEAQYRSLPPGPCCARETKDSNCDFCSFKFCKRSSFVLLSNFCFFSSLVFGFVYSALCTFVHGIHHLKDSVLAKLWLYDWNRCLTCCEVFTPQSEY